MKGGVAVMLAVAAGVTNPTRDLTWIFYDHEEVDSALNSLTRIAREMGFDEEFSAVLDKLGR